MMNMEFSNKTLAWLVVATIVVSLGGMIVSLNKIGQSPTALVADSNKTGNASVTIQSTTTLNFAVNALNFGSGSILAGAPFVCNMSNFNSTTIVHNAGFTSCDLFNNNTPANGYLQIENAGNQLMNISINFSTDARGFIGGGIQANAPAPQLWFKVDNNGSEVGSCANLNASTQAWTNVSLGGKWNVCQGQTGLQSTDNLDSMAIGINVSIPYDAPAGVGKAVIIQASGWN
jgi:hypothetical protein